MPRTASPLLTAAIVVGAVASTIAACRNATDITVTVTTDVKCDALVDTSIAVGGVGDYDTKAAVATKASCDPATKRIGALVVVPSGARDETVAFEIISGIGKSSSACDGRSADPGCIVARRELHFIPHESLTLPVTMHHECAAVVCPPHQTCVKGGVCASATVLDPSQCEPSAGCDETALTPPDGGAPDATIVDGANDANDAGNLDADADADADGDAKVPSTAKVACGEFASCARLADGRVFCWGKNDLAELARDPSSTPLGFSATPLLVPLPDRAIDVSVGDDHACAVIANGDVYCWGGNEYFTCGQPDGGAIVVTPARVAGVSGATEIHAGSSIGCARTASTVMCWGHMDDGELGNGGSPTTGVPAPLAFDAGIVELGLNGDALCATLAAGTVECWGAAFAGQTGDPALSPDPHIVTALPSARTVARAIAVSCAITNDAGVYCWGDPSDGLLGPSVAIDGGPHAAPVHVGGIDPATEISGSYSNACAVVPPSVLCWGDGNPLPQIVAPSAGVLDGVSVGLDFTCAHRASDDAILCWGENYNGQLGTGDVASRTDPIPIVFPP